METGYYAEGSEIRYRHPSGMTQHVAMVGERFDAEMLALALYRDEERERTDEAELAKLADAS